MDPINPIAGNPEAVNPNPQFDNHQAINPVNSNTITVVSVAVFILMAIGIIAFLYYQNQQLKWLLAKSQTIQVTPSPIPTISIDPTADWKSYSISPDPATGYAGYNIKLPESLKQVEHSSNFQNTETFQDSENIYQLKVEENKNINTQTGKPFGTLRDLTGLSYDSDIIVVDGQDSAKVLPRAGSENIYKVVFFSKNLKLTYAITLTTPIDGSKIKEGEVLFNQVLSAFKFASATASPSSAPTTVSTPPGTPNGY